MTRPSIGLLIAWILTFALAGSAPGVESEIYLPRDVDLVASLNVRQVLDSPAVKTQANELIRATLRANSEVQEAITAIGLDPLADFHRVTVGIGLENINSPRAIVVVDGKFDPIRISKQMDELIKKDPKQFGIEKVGGTMLYKIAPSKQPVSVYVAPINAKVIVFGTVREYVANAVDAAKDARKSEIRRELADLLAKADPKAALYVVAHTKGRLGTIPLPDADLKKMVQQVETIAGEIRLDRDLQAIIMLSTSSTESARQVQSLMESAISLYRLQLKLALADQPELRPLVELASSFKAVQKDRQIVITGGLNAAGIEKLLKPDKK